MYRPIDRAPSGNNVDVLNWTPHRSILPNQGVREYYSAFHVDPKQIPQGQPQTHYWSTLDSRCEILMDAAELIEEVSRIEERRTEHVYGKRHINKH